MNPSIIDGYLSAMVREGFISRSEALERLDYLKWNVEEKLQQLHEFLRDINLEYLVPHFS